MGFFKGLFASVGGIFTSAVGSVWRGIKGVASAAWGGLKSSVASTWSGIGRPLLESLGLGANVLNSIEEATAEATEVAERGARALVARAETDVATLWKDALHRARETILGWRALAVDLWNNIVTVLREGKARVLQGRERQAPARIVPRRRGNERLSRPTVERV